MFTDRELEDIQRTLTKCRLKNAERKLKKQLLEREYESKYPPFTPLQHDRYFFNRKTNEREILDVIEGTEETTTILLDTESTTTYRQQNRPVLIQIELIPNNRTSMVIIIEVNHLPRTDSNEFELMKEFFRIVLDSKKTIYTWGTVQELKPFAEFDLFNVNQICKPENEDLQEIFKYQWQQQHRHVTTNNCTCETCIGKKSNDKWKLMDAVAYQLSEWLTKKYTCSPFDVGLDPRLHQSNAKDKGYHEKLANYAANDVLAMEKLIISMQDQPSSKYPEQTSTQEEVVQNTIGQNMILLIHSQQQQHEVNHHEQLDHHEQVDCYERYDHEQFDHHEQVDYYERYELEPYSQHDIDIARRLRNRKRTIKQRQRHFRHEIIRRGIDPRWSVTMAKEALRRLDVPYTAVNISKSKITYKSSIYIGIEDPNRLHEYELRTRNVFTINIDEYIRQTNQIQEMDRM